MPRRLGLAKTLASQQFDGLVGGPDEEITSTDRQERDEQGDGVT